jgi:hypothetical protein
VPLIEAVQGPAIASSHRRCSEKERFSDEAEWVSGDGQEVWARLIDTTRQDCPPDEVVRLDLWAPSRRYCAKRQIFPDLFLAIRNEAAIFKGRTLTFNPYLVLAIDADLPEASRLARGAVPKIAEILPAALCAYRERPWGVPYGKLGYTNAIGDLMAVGLFKVGAAHMQQPTLAMLENGWSVFP